MEKDIQYVGQLLALIGKVGVPMISDRLFVLLESQCRKGLQRFHKKYCRTAMVSNGYFLNHVGDSIGTIRRPRRHFFPVLLRSLKCRSAFECLGLS